jgi:hypothetical protein
MGLGRPTGLPISTESCSAAMRDREPNAEPRLIMRLKIVLPGLGMMAMTASAPELLL